MKKEFSKLSFLLFGIAIGIIIMLIVSINFNAINYRLQFKIHGYTQENALAVCSGKDLKQTAICLNSFVKGIYKYKSRKDAERPSFEELVSEGGDCRNWQMLTCKLATKIGYKCTKVSIPIRIVDNIQYAHTFAIIHSSEGYAKFDGKGVNIFLYKR